jgi:hypothetical protein
LQTGAIRAVERLGSSATVNGENNTRRYDTRYTE